VFYTQERIGKDKKPFLIYKFRTMISDAEKNGPELSYFADKRITKFGKFLRKTRLDEIPQFINVLQGHMSIIGYRPERQFYIDQITKHCPEYLKLLKNKPGITSLGQIEFGYAFNIDQMLIRLKYDLFYHTNKSILLDIKILVFTILIILNIKKNEN
jgi:lipopolysaccharide/colanic/teichoic acid biosynthesis glycosyltransferase